MECMKNWISIFFALAIFTFPMHSYAECKARGPDEFKFLYLVRTYGIGYRAYTEEEIERLEKEYKDFNASYLRNPRSLENNRKDDFYATRYAKYGVIREARERQKNAKPSKDDVFGVTPESLFFKEVSVDALEKELKDFEKNYWINKNKLREKDRQRERKEAADHSEVLNEKRNKLWDLRSAKVYTLPVVKTINGSPQKILKDITIIQGDAPDLLPGRTYMIPMDTFGQKTVDTCDIWFVSKVSK